MRITRTLSMLCLALTLPAMAQTAPAPHQEGQHGMLQGRMAEQLKLTETQKASLAEIAARHQAGLDAKGKAARDARRAFHDAFRQTGTTPDALAGLNRAMADTRLESMLEWRAMFQEWLPILTPDQRVQAAWMLGRKAGGREAADPVELKAIVEEVHALRAIVDEINKPVSPAGRFAKINNGS